MAKINAQRWAEEEAAKAEAKREAEEAARKAAANMKAEDLSAKREAARAAQAEGDRAGVKVSYACGASTNLSLSVPLSTSLSFS